jgi:uncharacterized protein (DUF433 family)
LIFFDIQFKCRHSLSYRRQDATDAHILEGHPDLCAADLVNAFSYAEAYPDEIETAIQENEED